MTGLKRILSLFIAALTVICTGCSQKDIECEPYRQHDITVSLIWPPTAESLPRGVTLMFYPLSHGAQIWRFDISGHEGGPVSIPEGEYSLLVFNNDLPGVEIARSGSYINACACLKKESSGICPGSGMLYAGCVDYLEVTPCGVTYTTSSGEYRSCGKSVVKCEMQPRSCRYTVRVIDIKNSNLIRSAKAVLGGMASEVTLARDTRSESESALGISLKKDGNSDLSGSSSCFGCAAMSQSYQLTLSVTRTDNKTLRKEFDVTNQIISHQTIAMLLFF